MKFRFVYNCLFFFFQAEDGIRDYKVTGVQTCALPISPRRTVFGRISTSGRCLGASPTSSVTTYSGRTQIGRASCRERGVDLGGRRIIKKKKTFYCESLFYY